MGMGLIVSKMALHKIQCEKQIQVNKFMAPEKKFTVLGITSVCEAKF